jgi:hypothetical protein
MREKKLTVSEKGIFSQNDTGYRPPGKGQKKIQIRA